MITGKTQLLGVIGYPIEHSLSPVMHNAAIAALGVDFAYLPFAIAPDELPQAIAGFGAIGLQGFNVTIPHKQAIIPLLSAVTPLAQAIGAVNTVWRTEQGWHGTNTDVAGFLAPLRSQPHQWQSSCAVVLGNGGAARAVVAGCAQLGFAQVQVVGRKLEKLQAFLQSWSDSLLAVNLSVHQWDELPELLPAAGLLVNTTPIGMAPNAEASPVTAIELQKLPSSAIVYDLIYTPRPTQFLRLAESQGNITIDGLEMLVQQGATALEQWLQHAVPGNVMRQAVLNCLRNQT